MKIFLISALIGVSAVSAYATEGKDLTPPFALNQRSTAISDLYAKKDASQLCVPTAIANAMLYLRKYRKPPFSKLKVPYDQDGGGRTSPYDLVRYLVDLCNTDKNGGTAAADGGLCIATYFLHSGYEKPAVRVVGASQDYEFKNGMNLPYQRLPRAVEPGDIQAGIDHELPLLGRIKWRVKDKQGKWIIRGGHYITIYGYQKGTRGFRVKITDPWNHYPNAKGQYSEWVELRQIPKNDRLGMGTTDKWYLVGDGSYGEKPNYRPTLSAVVLAAPEPVKKH